MPRAKRIAEPVIEVLGAILAMQGPITPAPSGGGISPEMAALLGWLLTRSRKRKKRRIFQPSKVRLVPRDRAIQASFEAAELPEVFGILASPEIHVSDIKWQQQQP